jgi:hypothetical protein
LSLLEGLLRGEISLSDLNALEALAAFTDNAGNLDRNAALGAEGVDPVEMDALLTRMGFDVSQSISAAKVRDAVQQSRAEFALIDMAAVRETFSRLGLSFNTVTTQSLLATVEDIRTFNGGNLPRFILSQLSKSEGVADMSQAVAGLAQLDMVKARQSIQDIRGLVQLLNTQDLKAADKENMTKGLAKLLGVTESEINLETLSQLTLESFILKQMEKSKSYRVVSSILNQRSMRMSLEKRPRA